MLELYLIRHGIAGDAESYETDAERSLTNEGKQKTKKVAKRLFDLKLHFDLILTSPLVRARQTAAILQAVGLSSQLEESDHLATDGDIHNWLVWLETWRRDSASAMLSDMPRARLRSRPRLALVGHEPNLASWAETLVWGSARGGLILKKAGVIGLQLPETGSPVGNSYLFWLVSPKLLL